MSHDPRYISSPHRAPAPSPLDSTRPAVFHRARVVEIKRRGPSSSTRVSALPAEQQQQPTMDPPRYRSSPPARVGASQTASTSPNSRHARNYALSSPSPTCDVPPPPPPHSPSQRSVSIAQGSYMDYDSSTPPSRSAHFSRPHPRATTSAHSHQQRELYGSRDLPSAATLATPGFPYEVATDMTAHRAAHQSAAHQPAPPPLLSRRREEYDPTTLLPTRVRPPQAFHFELEEEPLRRSSSQPDIPGRFPSSPDTARSSISSADAQMGGLQENLPELRPKSGSYSELQPYELGVVYSNPAPYQTPVASSERLHQHRGNPAEPFLYEIRSPQKGDHIGSNEASATSMRAAYSARNPADEAKSYPLLRRLGADERYATSFRKQLVGDTPEHVVADEYGRQETAIGEARTSGDADVSVLEMERHSRR